MIQSFFIQDILNLLFEDLPFEETLRKQIAFLSVERRDYTGSGVFIYFEREAGVEDLRADAVDADIIKINGDRVVRIDGVEIDDQKQTILADAIVYLKNGLIDMLEIWNKNGKDYPMEEPVSYSIRQLWRGEANREISRE